MQSSWWSELCSVINDSLSLLSLIIGLRNLLVRAVFQRQQAHSLIRYPTHDRKQRTLIDCAIKHWEAFAGFFLNSALNLTFTHSSVSKGYLVGCYNSHGSTKTFCWLRCPPRPLPILWKMIRLVSGEESVFPSFLSFFPSFFFFYKNRFGCGCRAGQHAACIIKKHLRATGFRRKSEWAPALGFDHSF